MFTGGVAGFKLGGWATDGAGEATLFCLAMFASAARIECVLGTDAVGGFTGAAAVVCKSWRMF